VSLEKELVAKRPHRLEKQIEIAAPIEEVWSALTDSRKLANWFPLEARVTPGKSFALTTTDGERLSGQVELVKEPRGICLRVTEWNDLLFWVSLEGGDGNVNGQIWISTFGVPQNRVDELNSIWSGRLKKLFR
jgi:uncharacterized protein YndB with AHSA1/START domain